MKKKNLYFSLFLTSIILVSCTPKQSITSFEAMNTFMTVNSYGKNSQAANDAVKLELEKLESYFSTTITESDIYKLNHAPDNKQAVHEETFDLVSYAVRMATETDGALNPVLFPVTSAWGFTTGEYRVPSEDEISRLLKNVDYRLIAVENNGDGSYNISLGENMMMDLGAVGKGYAGDAAVRILKDYGIESALLDLGGNIQTIGKKVDKSEWKIGIKNPWDGTIAAGLSISDLCVITSGGYERFFTADDGTNYIHIFDGKTGWPVMNDLASVTIVCKDGVYGDALSTAMFVKGSEAAIEYWKKHRDYEMILITKDRKIIYTAGLKNRLQLMHVFSATEIIK